jgi:class 3 adenylate cyclase
MIRSSQQLAIMRICIAVFLAAVCVTCASCSHETKGQPLAVKGMLDARGWDYSTGGSLSLDGEWTFAWQQYLMDRDFDILLSPQYFVQPASSWMDFKPDGVHALPRYGYASYRLRLIVDQAAGPFAIVVPVCPSACRLFCNDSLLLSAGIPGASKDSTVPGYRKRVLQLPSNRDTLSIILHIANFHYRIGGLRPIAFGRLDDMMQGYRSTFANELLFAGGLFFLFIVFLTLYLYRRVERLALLFSALLGIHAMRVLTTDFRAILDLWPSLSWNWMVCLEVASAEAAVILLPLYLYIFYSGRYSRYVLWAFVAFGSAILLVDFVTSPAVFSMFVPLGSVVVLCSIIYSWWVSIRSLGKGVDGAVLMFVGVTASVVIVALYEYDIFIVDGRMHFGIPDTVLSIPMMAAQVIILSRRFSRAITRVENISRELEIEVKARTRELNEEKEKSDALLLNVLPVPIADRLRRGEAPIADHFEEASVMFIDIVDFTYMTTESRPEDVVKLLNNTFTQFDKVTARHGLEKIKTIGDCYMVASGIPVPRTDHASAIAAMALDVMSKMRGYVTADGRPIRFRIGLDCGPTIAGVIGEQKFIYDLWGDMVNTASRMETTGVIDGIQCTERFKNTLERYTAGHPELHRYRFELRGEIEVKGKGLMRTWILKQLSQDN